MNSIILSKFRSIFNFGKIKKITFLLRLSIVFYLICRNNTQACNLIYKTQILLYYINY